MAVSDLTSEVFYQTSTRSFFDQFRLTQQHKAIIKEHTRRHQMTQRERQQRMRHLEAVSLSNVGSMLSMNLQSNLDRAPDATSSFFNQNEQPMHDETSA